MILYNPASIWCVIHFPSLSMQLYSPELRLVVLITIGGSDGPTRWRIGLSASIDGFISEGFQQETMDSGIKLIGDNMGEAGREWSI